jgi:dTDP-4-amino-4,6-dideoxygalactose transaminase
MNNSNHSNQAHKPNKPNKILFTRPVFKDAEQNILKRFMDHPELLIGNEYLDEARAVLTQHYGTLTLPTHSCAAALEMSAILLDIQPGDEVIIPTYTFVATANPFVLRGAKIRFVDMRSDTLNFDEAQLESAINAKTRAIVVMHYAGVACDMDKIMAVAKAKNLPVVEDAAQCIDAKYKGKLLGTFGNLGALSFHNTKNITSGLGGALIINDPQLRDRSKVLWQRGTNREAYLEGQVDKYTWVDVGSSFVMSELSAGLLVAQLSRHQEILKSRVDAWNIYQKAFEFVEEIGFRRPFVPKDSEHNGHVYFLMAPSDEIAKKVRSDLNALGVSSSSHYVPLHLSPAGKKYSANPEENFPVAESMYSRLIRLPLWEGVDTARVIEAVKQVLKFSEV